MDSCSASPSKNRTSLGRKSWGLTPARRRKLYRPVVKSRSRWHGQDLIYFKGGGGRPGIYFKAGSATTEGPGPDPQSTFTPNLLSLGIYFQRPAGSLIGF